MRREGDAWLALMAPALVASGASGGSHCPPSSVAGADDAVGATVKVEHGAGYHEVPIQARHRVESHPGEQTVRCRASVRAVGSEG